MILESEPYDTIYLGLANIEDISKDTSGMIHWLFLHQRDFGLTSSQYILIE